MTEPMKVVGIVVTKESTTLYDPNLKKHVFKQGDPNLKHIKEDVLPEFLKNQVAYFSPKKVEDVYSTFESNSKVIKFFTMAREYLTKFFKKEEDGRLSAQLKRLLENDRTGLQKLKIEEFGGTKPIDLSANNAAKNDPFESSETVAVAVTNDGKIIPDVNRLMIQLNHANEIQDVLGMEKFLERLGNIIQERDHSVEDVIRFLQHSDLPITSKGNILVYKVLNKSEDGKYVDCHTGMVKQWVGSIVEVPDDYVDRNRNQECSQGLHVARRSYLSSFRADVCVLCIVQPEDIIAVPHYDADKVRVRKYHIINTLNQEEYNNLLNNKSFVTDDINSQVKYNSAIKEHYSPATHVITIQGENGSNIVVKDLGSMNAMAPREPDERDLAEEKMLKIEDTIESIQPNKPETLSVKETISLTRKEQMLALLPVTTIEDALTIMDWKRSQKKSWDTLGVSAEHAELIENLLK